MFYTHYISFRFRKINFAWALFLFFITSTSCHLQNTEEEQQAYTVNKTMHDSLVKTGKHGYYNLSSINKT
jgi:hypothetical protein